MVFDITTEVIGLEQTLSAIALLVSPEWLTNTLKANKQVFSDLERQHYNKVSATTRYANPKRAGEGNWGIDTEALFRELTENIIVEDASLSIGSDLPYAAIVDELLGHKQAIGQAQESSLLPSDDEFYALLEPLLLGEAEAIWSGK
ncbi:MAG: hypothetical protein KME45_03460 [Stenomitos rutilans HA7619-LM2]|nr:hypothetical protein [Stenomitos rutilans HA7619-LM2]MBW4469443.1 hypothetical protein [Stenomitos rutilans HA7619-LM2]